MNRVQGILLILVAALVITCIGLAVVVGRYNAGNTQVTIVGPGPLTQTTTATTTLTSTAATTTTGGTEPWETDVRLPKHLIPLHYDLWLYPNLETELFDGHVSIDIQATKTAEYFLVHTKLLTISDTNLFDEDDEEVDIKEAFEYKENEYWVVIPEKPAPAGNYTLKLKFNGDLAANGIVGFYKSVYKNSKGEERPIATSKFQPTDARKAFPCFDEPSFKSTFTVTLIRPSEEYIALSNMPVESEKENSPSPGLTEVKFQKSVPMVTYLACFIVCDFDYKEKLTEVHSTKFRVYATPEQKHRVQYSLDIGANISDYLTDYFEIPYPLPKQDMIAIPDFVSGAMEHWGLITYRETNLLYDEEESASANKQRVATVVSHELVHMWFGNLVTLDWWDDLWLNEGFASYMEYKGVDNYHPDWEMGTQFLIADLHDVLDLDSTINSHPIVQEVNHPNQITEIFDRISYGKGASVLRMLEHFMGPEEFRMGIHKFLSDHKYANAVTQDLWTALESVTTKGLSISRIMDTWTRQMGYPVLNIEKIADNQYRVTQKRFLKDKTAESDSAPSPYNYKWDVPITYITDQNNDPTFHWLTRYETDTVIEVDQDAEWVKFNVGQYGYYRVNYHPDQWATLADLLVNDPEALGPMDRASLLNDAFALAEAGEIDYTIPLEMTSYLSEETHYVPWDTVYNSLQDIGDKLSKTQVYRKYRKYIVKLVADHYLRLGWKDVGSHTTRLNRISIIGLACKYGYKPCNNEAEEIFNKWINDPEYYIKPNLRSLVYKYGMQASNDPDAWEIMFKRYVTEINSQEKSKLLYGLSQVKEPWILDRFLVLAKNESNIRSQDYLTALRYISVNPIGNSIVWNFIRSEWDYLVDRFTIHNRYLGRVPQIVVKDFSTEFQLEQVKQFFAANPEGGAGTRARAQALEAVENNIKWLDQHYQEIESWLDERKL